MHWGTKRSVQVVHVYIPDKTWRFKLSNEIYFIVLRQMLKKLLLYVFIPIDNNLLVCQYLKIYMNKYIYKCVCTYIYVCVYRIYVCMSIQYSSTKSNLLVRKYLNINVYIFRYLRAGRLLFADERVTQMSLW